MIDAKRVMGFGTAALATVITLLACVGDDPLTATDTGDGATGADTGQPQGDGAAPGDAGGDGSSSPDAADAAPEPATAVAAGITDPYGLAITSQAAVILTATKLLRCPQKNCLAPAVLADNLAAPVTPPFPKPYLIDADDTAIHWVSQNITSASKYYYFRCALTGCAGVNAEFHPYGPASEILAPAGLSLDAMGFARIGEKGDVLACDATTCTPILGVDVDSTRAFAIDGTTVLWTDTTDPAGTKKATAGAAGTAMPLHTTPGHVVATQGANVYTLTPTKILVCAKAGCNGIPTVFVENELDLTSMAVGPSGVYWTSNGGSVGGGIVKTCPLSGCGGGPRIIATGQAGPTSVRLKAGTVYWIDRGAAGAATGMLMRAGQ